MMKPAMADPFAQMTPRERLTAKLVAQGHVNFVIAEKMGISESSVENYINSIYQQIGITRDHGVHPRVCLALLYVHYHQPRRTVLVLHKERVAHG